jgi:hypothetical protein
MFIETSPRDFENVLKAAFMSFFSSLGDRARIFAFNVTLPVHRLENHEFPGQSRCLSVLIQVDSM